MTPDLLPCVEVSPRGPVKRSVIWLHGLGADGHDFEPIVPYLRLPDDLGVRFVFPHAPKRAVTINMGLIMPAWYDVRAQRLETDEDEAGIRDSATKIEALMAREVGRGVATGDIVLAGFSQGGALALHVALRHAERLGGVVALSCYLLAPSSLEKERSAANEGVPIFQAHGTDDPLVPIAAGLMARDRLVALGYDVTWKEYPMEHTVAPEEIEAIGAWLRAGSAKPAARRD